MLSKKMAVSLTSLITIFALAFAVTPAMAAEITISLKDADGDTPDNQGDLSAKDGNQVAAGTDVTLEVKTDELFGQFPQTEADADDLSVFDIVSSAALPDPAIASVTRSGDGKMYTLVIDGDDTGTPIAAGTTVTVFLKANKLQSLTAGKAMHESALITLEYIDRDQIVPAAATATVPKVISIARADGESQPIAKASLTFIITLSEMPKEFKKDKITLANAELFAFSAHGTVDSDPTPADSTTALADQALEDAKEENKHTGNEFTLVPSAGDSPTDDARVTGKLYRYAVTVKPSFAGHIKITVAQFEDLFGNKSADPAKKEQEFKVSDSLIVPEAGKAGIELGIPNDLIIPANGSLIVAKDDGDGTNTEEKVSESLIMWPGDPKDTAAMIARRKPNLRTYNVIEANLENLATFLINGGTIDLKSAHAVKITEIMWGLDGDSQNRQWIEITNTTAEPLTTKDYKLMFYAANEAVPPMTAAVAATATTAAVPAGLPAGVADRVGTIYKGGYWSVGNTGQSGRTSDTRKLGETDIEIVVTSSLVSMQRGMPDAMGKYPDGTMSSSWMASEPPSLNFKADAKGLLIGTPGAAPIISEAAMKQMEADAKAKADKAKADADAAAAKKAGTGTVPDAGAIYISEIMVDRGNGLPQWLEISNGSRTEDVNLSKWTLTVNNAAADADVSVGGSIMFTIPDGTMIKRSGQNTMPSTLLVVTEMGRNDLGGLSADHVLNLWEAGQTELILAGVTKRRYSLLSNDAFLITLAPPAPMATKLPATATAKQKADAKAQDLKDKAKHAAATDMAGNLGADGAAAWALPMGEDGAPRSSLIRAHVQVSVGPAEPEDGKMMDTWRLASMTSFAHPTHIRRANYYGAANDVGTPGYRAGGALPVELSHFRPARDKATGQVIIAWSTQSELNNAGFFIKRSQQRNGEFKVINATMVPGAGTTSEKQFYTYTDTTAQPNVVYYYQIEDVSLDGNRQTLTRGIRLKGHVGAAGKATTLWGELKTSHE